MSFIYDTTGFTHIKTVDYSEIYNEVGLEPNTKDVVFETMSFYYSARCLNDIIQFVKGQRPDEPLHNYHFPSYQEIQDHNSREEWYNGNHQPLQDWIDNLTI